MFGSQQKLLRIAACESFAIVLAEPGECALDNRGLYGQLFRGRGVSEADRTTHGKKFSSQRSPYSVLVGLFEQLRRGHIFG